jgi:hypothetical protein
VQVQVNESGSFHAGGYSNLARQFWLCRDEGFSQPSKIL